MSTTTHADVLILGGGLVGATLALALAKHGLTGVVVDPADPAVTLAPGFDGRASAIASASGRMLEAIGLGARLAGLGQPIASIRVSDGLAPGRLDFTPDADDGALGVMYENRALRRAIHAAMGEAGVDLRMRTAAVAVERGEHGVTATLDDGAVVRAPLLVAAEGRNSPTRAAAGINVARWKYDDAAIVGAFHHARPHEGVAYEIFYPAGPFALLPLVGDADGHRSAIVWTVAARDAAGMLKLSDRAFLHEAEKRMGGLLGALSGASPRVSWPLGFHLASRITAERLALVGDAAHGIHPIAGQGLNLGLRDVAALTEVLVEGKRTGLDLGDAALLARYQRWRALDTGAIAAATDGLARLFGIPGRTASAVRRLGLAAVNAVDPLKRAFMAEARGEAGELPALLRGALV
ncbi:FAD-dependent monooxygenase [uncultured Sphingomonas sp.]|uniref:FAD-dependent monooxygenase n=1 Tax=uncultured Sphingomonas sp. TaxID=158754 RepID=UPI0035C949EC